MGISSVRAWILICSLVSVVASVSTVVSLALKRGWSAEAHSPRTEARIMMLTTIRRSAPDVLAAVKTGLTQFGTNKVTVTGHSLGKRLALFIGLNASMSETHSKIVRTGAAIALIDSIFLPLNIPGITTRFVGYGLPRVGNQDFADYVDAQPIEVTHINNEEDIVPILPGKFLGYHHPSGEVHIQDSGAWLACPGIST